MSDQPPHRRTLALLRFITGRRPIGGIEFVALTTLCMLAGMAIGTAAFVALPVPALVVVVGLCAAAAIWVVHVAQSYIRWYRGQR